MSKDDSAVEVDVAADGTPQAVRYEGRVLQVRRVVDQRKRGLSLAKPNAGRRYVTVELDGGLQLELSQSPADGTWTLERVSQQRISSRRIATLVYAIAAVVFLAAGVARLVLVGDLMGLGSVTIAGGLVLAALREQGLLHLPGVARYLPELFLLLGLWLYVLHYLGV